jgi:molecular chaperone IbpA
MPDLGSTSHSCLIYERRIKMTQFEFKTLDLPTLHRHVIGFDRVFDEINRTFANSRSTGAYPPYNISKLDETHFLLEVAVAGFSEEELDVSLNDQRLTITGKKTEADSKEDVEYLHRGISARDWERVFTLGPDHEVRGAMVKNGILTVAVEHVIPNEKKPRKIAITYTK